MAAFPASKAHTDSFGVLHALAAESALPWSEGGADKWRVAV